MRAGERRKTSPGVGVINDALPAPNAPAPASGPFRRWLANRSLAQRVAGGFVLAFALVVLLALTGYGILIAFQRDFGAFSSVDTASRVAADIGLGMSRVEVAVRDHLAENDPGSLEEARVRHEALDTLIQQVRTGLKTKDDLAAADEMLTRLAAYWKGIETILDLRIERARLVNESVEAEAAQIVDLLERHKTAGGADSLAFSTDLTLGMARLKAHLTRFVERRDAGDGAEIRNLLAAAQGRLGEMNRYLWVPGTIKIKAALETQYAALAKDVDRIEETLLQEDRVRADDLAPNAARVIELAEILRKSAAGQAEQVRAGLAQAGMDILRIGTWIGGAILLLGLLAMAYTTYAVSRPIKAVSRAMRDLAAGNDITSLPALVRNDEIAEIAGAVRTLSAAETERIQLRERIERMHDELLAAKERAEADSTAKTDFLVNMGQDLHRPLVDVARHAEDLMGELHRQGMGQLAEDAERIQWSVERLTEQIEAILDYAKIEAGTAGVSVEDIDIAQLTTLVRERCASAADINGDALAVFVAPGTGTMRSDADKVQRILLNLVDNACKFTRNGDVTLAVERVEREGQPWLSFTVTDTGCGFPAAQAGRLFRPFVRGGAVNGAKGAGLGLTIVAHYCALLGGRIEVASTPGRGTRIAVHLPAVHAGDHPPVRIADAEAVLPMLTVEETPAD